MSSFGPYSFGNIVRGQQGITASIVVSASVPANQIWYYPANSNSFQWTVTTDATADSQTTITTGWIDYTTGVTSDDVWWTPMGAYRLGYRAGRRQVAQQESFWPQELGQDAQEAQQRLWRDHGLAAYQREQAQSDAMVQAFSQQQIEYEEQQRRAQEMLNRQIERASQGQAAHLRAMKLLKANLSEVQRDSLETRGYFLVHSQNGNVYRIYRGRVRNVVQVIDETPMMRFCAHPFDQVPDGDTMLCQKLMLEANEAEFLRIANRSAAA